MRWVSNKIDAFSRHYRIRRCVAAGTVTSLTCPAAGTRNPPSTAGYVRPLAFPGDGLFLDNKIWDRKGYVGGVSVA